MGSSTTHSHDMFRCGSALFALIISVVCVSTAHAAGESILLPGYVRQNNFPPATGNQSLPATLPGWSTPKPGYIPVNNLSGLKLIVDNSWPDLPGYRMIRIEFLANQPFAEAKSLRVQLKLQNNNHSREEMTVTSDEIVLPAGQSAVKYQLYYPSQGPDRIREIRTTEDGESLKDLSCNDIYSGQSNTNTLAYLDLTGLQANTVTATGSLNIQGVFGVSAAPGPVTQSETHEYRSGAKFSYPLMSGWSGIQNYAELPNSPLGYDCFKVVFCRVEQLESIRKDYPIQWSALRSWVATGGKILAWPEEFNKTESVHQAQLKLDSLFPQGEASTEETPHASWTSEKISSTAEKLLNLQIDPYENNYAIPASPMNTPSGNSGGQATITFPERAWFQGTIAVLPDHQHIQTVFAYLHNATQQPLPATSLPRVGLPPITMFQILITLFVILIGPVNYFYFKKKKQLNWLLITVPAGALAITGLLLTYTLLKDGIGVRNWSQSYTILDQVQKSAATRQQFCLFAGITPGDGLRFRSRTNFSDPSERQTNTNRYGYRYRDSRNWDYSWDTPTDESSDLSKQHLRTGWLPARTLKLFETNEYDACQRELQIQISGESCELTNKLGSKIISVYVADGERVWSTTDISADDHAAASLLSAGKIQNLKTSLENELFPRTQVFDVNDRHALPPQSAAIKEHFLGLRRLHQRVYLAVVERWPDLQSGVVDPTVESWGPHVILGVW